jgi:hypothetical protein
MHTYAAIQEQKTAQVTIFDRSGIPAAECHGVVEIMRRKAWHRGELAGGCACAVRHCGSQRKVPRECGEASKDLSFLLCWFHQLGLGVLSGCMEAFASAHFVCKCLSMALWAVEAL